LDESTQTDGWIVPFFLVETALNLWDPSNSSKYNWSLSKEEKKYDLLWTWVLCRRVCLPSTIVLLLAYGFQIVEETMWHLNSKLCLPYQSC
jgi:hypothetical protein